MSVGICFCSAWSMFLHLFGGFSLLMGSLWEPSWRTVDLEDRKFSVFTLKISLFLISWTFRIFLFVADQMLTNFC